MQGSALIRPVKVVGYVIVVLMAAAMVYSIYTASIYWAGIGV